MSATLQAFKETLKIGPPLSADIMADSARGLHRRVSRRWKMTSLPADYEAFTPPGRPGLMLQSNDGLAYVNMQSEPAVIDATVDGGLLTRIHIVEGMIDATVDDGPTNVHIEANLIKATVDDGVTFVELVPGVANVTAGTVAVTGNMFVTGNIGITGTVDGIDVSTHTHGGVMPGGGSTSGPS